MSYCIRLNIIDNEIIKTVGTYESCMVSKLQIIFKRTRMYVTTIVESLALNSSIQQYDDTAIQRYGD
eukprot:COSAG05_NODE_2276_length_3296_cov_4097.429152_3_plen_67_part_00